MEETLNYCTMFLNRKMSRPLGTLEGYQMRLDGALCCLIFELQINGARSVPIALDFTLQGQVLKRFEETVEELL